MSKQQKANAHGQPCEWQPLLHKRHGLAEGQGYRPSPVQATPIVLPCPVTQQARKHLGHSETEVLFTVQKGHGRYTCSNMLRGLGPYLHENRPIESTWRASKWLGARPQAEGIRWPAQQAARRKQLCPDDAEAVLHRLQKMREEVEDLQDQLYELRFRAIFSSMEKDKESPTKSRRILQGPPSPTLEATAAPSKRYSTCSVTKGTAAETPKQSELVSLDPLWAKLGPASDESLSCDALVKELLENWDQEGLPDREAAGERDSEAQRTFLCPPQDKEGCVLSDGSRLSPELAEGSQGLHSMSLSTLQHIDTSTCLGVITNLLLMPLATSAGETRATRPGLGTVDTIAIDQLHAALFPTTLWTRPS
ncbi:hypothetical protein TURU_004282 [Turdus rufiventris]|nr:hypothetical protein TURU_004282 [Turdus rufiventris]